MDDRAFAIWNADLHCWDVPDGTYMIQICRNAQEVILEKEVQVKNTKRPRQKYTANTCMGELMSDPKAQQILGQMMAGDEQAKEMADSAVGDVINQEMLAAMMQDMPLRQLVSFVPGMTWDSVNGLLSALNAD